MTGATCKGVDVKLSFPLDTSLLLLQSLVAVSLEKSTATGGHGGE